MMRNYLHRLCYLPLLLIVTASTLSCRSTPAPTRSDNMVINLSAEKEINSDEFNVAKPVQLIFFQLKRTELFEKEDFFTLTTHDNKSTEPVLRKIDDMMVQPGETRKFTLPVEKGTLAIGVVAAYRNIERSQWKAVYPLPEPAVKPWYKKLWFDSSSSVFIPEATVEIRRLHVSIR
jgi:type VI secretion system protein VasD